MTIRAIGCQLHDDDPHAEQLRIVADTAAAADGLMHARHGGDLQAYRSIAAQAPCPSCLAHMMCTLLVGALRTLAQKAGKPVEAVLNAATVGMLSNLEMT